jgi:hypothetical protein
MERKMAACKSVFEGDSSAHGAGAGDGDSNSNAISETNAILRAELKLTSRRLI